MSNVVELQEKRSRKHLEVLALIELFREKYGVWPIPLELRMRLHYTEQRELYRIEREEAVFRAQERSAIAKQEWIASGGPERLRRRNLVIGLLTATFKVCFAKGGILDAIFNVIAIVGVVWALFYILWLFVR